jgi:3-methyladenine DNA glycosylase Tag
MGPAIILPREATTMAGLDFDIDKLYFMSRAFTVNKKGIPKIVKYIKAPKNKTEALESASNIYADFKSFKKFAEKYIKDPKQREAVLEARRALTDKQVSNTLSSK